MAVLYYNSNVDQSWDSLGNWFTDEAAILSASELPSSSDDVIVLPGSTIDVLEDNRVVNSITFNNANLYAYDFNLSATNVIFNNTSILDYTTIFGNVVFNNSTIASGTINGNVTLSAGGIINPPTEGDPTTINGNLTLYYPSTVNAQASNEFFNVTGTVTKIGYKFEGYPDYNFTVSGIVGDDTLNQTFYYSGFQEGKHRWDTLDGTALLEWSASGEVGYWTIQGAVEYYTNDIPLSSSNPWSETSWYTTAEGVSGTPSFTLIPYNKSNILVSGINPDLDGIDLNGEYVLGERGFEGWWSDPADEQVGVNGNRPYYVKTNGSLDYEDWSYVIVDNEWTIYNDNISSPYTFGSSSANPYYPTEVDNWTANIEGAGTPVITFASASSDPVAQRDAKYATATEAGAVRFRRLVGLGYV